MKPLVKGAGRLGHVRRAEGPQGCYRDAQEMVEHPRDACPRGPPQDPSLRLPSPRLPQAPLPHAPFAPLPTPPHVVAGPLLHDGAPTGPAPQPQSLLYGLADSSLSRGL